MDTGKTVAIVADGDPTIYSPWGWIPEHFTDLKPNVIPGISSFNAANAALKHGVWEPVTSYSQPDTICRRAAPTVASAGYSSCSPTP